MNSQFRLFLTLVTAAMAGAPLPAQTPTAAVTGIVRDEAHGALADAEVSGLNLSTGLTYRVPTSSEGSYWLRGLPPGDYDITATRIGLRSTTVQDVELEVGRTVPINFELTASAVELAPLMVSVNRPLIETTRSEVSFVLDRAQVGRLPEESRQFIELAHLVPGATVGTEATGGPPPFGTSGSSVGALNRQSLGVLVDGGDFTESMFGDLSGSLPMLAIREFEVIQSQYSAELGRAASGVVNVVSRRGGNELEAEAFWLYRDRALNALGAFEAEKPAFRRSHFGASVGGPLAVDRTHFFAAFERRDERDFSTVNTGGAFPSFEGTFETPFTDNLVFARLDHRVNDAHELTLRYTGEVGEQLFGVGGNRSIEYGQNNKLDMHSGLLTHRWTLPGTWLNEARLHVIGSERALERNAPFGPTLVYPSLSTGPHESDAWIRSLRVELRNDLSWVATGPSGTHALRLGAHVSWLHNETRTSFFENGLFRFERDGDPLPALARISFDDPALRLDAHNVQLALYAQDDWNPMRGLTLNLGVRYDLETNGTDQGFVSPYADALPFVPGTPRSIDKDNLAPRVGFAWDFSREGRTVVRGGFGVFYDALVAGPLVAVERSSGVPLAAIPDPGTTDVGALAIEPDTLPVVVWTAPEIETPMTRQYSLGVQHLLPGDVVVRVDALYVQGRNLLLVRNLNPIDPLTRMPRFQGFSQISEHRSAGRASAKMLLVQVRKAFSVGWLDIGYTLADRRNTNDTSGELAVPQTDPGALDLRREWGPAAWDERHRVVTTGGIELPFGLEAVVKTIYASARPFTAITGEDDNGDLDFRNDRPPGEERNARRGPDFFRTDLSITWSPGTWKPTRVRLVLNLYNVLNRTNGVPASVQPILGAPLFGQATEALQPRQAELGVRIAWSGGR